MYTYRLLEYEVWVERERLAQEEFRKKREREEKIQREREEREVGLTLQLCCSSMSYS